MVLVLALAMDCKAEIKLVPLGPFAVKKKKKKSNKSQYIVAFMPS